MPAAWVKHWVATKTASRTSVGRLLDSLEDSCSAEAKGFVRSGIIPSMKPLPEIRFKCREESGTRAEQGVVRCCEGGGEDEVPDVWR